MALFDSFFERNRSGRGIFSFDIITLNESGMRYKTEYEIVSKDEKAEVSQYGIRFIDHEDRRILEKQSICSADDILELLNKCCILSWNGFVGAHPKGVKDGIMFSLNAVVNRDKKIHANGSQNFPKHYRDFTDGLYNILNAQKTDL